MKRETKTVPSCYRLGLHSRDDYSKRWWALTPPFHLFH